MPEHASRCIQLFGSLPLQFAFLGPDLLELGLHRLLLQRLPPRRAPNTDVALLAPAATTITTTPSGSVGSRLSGGRAWTKISNEAGARHRQSMRTHGASISATAASTATATTA